MKKLDQNLDEFKVLVEKAKEYDCLYPADLRKVAGYLFEIPYFPTHHFDKSYVVHLKDGMFLIPYEEIEGDHYLYIKYIAHIDSTGLQIVEQLIKDLKNEIQDLTYILEHHKLKRLFMK
jgi:hypothetical protein